MGRLELAENVVQGSLCKALETWSVQGVPDNPSAWLMRVARNRAIDLVRRDDPFRYSAPEIVHLLRLREKEGLAELSSIPEVSKLSDYPFYPAAQGD